MGAPESSQTVAEPPRELVLRHSPLVRVLSQVRWPRFGDFDLDAAAKGLGSIISADYPILEQGRETEVTITPLGAQQQLAGVLHKFSAIDGSWTVTLGETFLALETSAYESHSDFIGRLERIMQALSRVAEIRVWDRLGYRYTNRLSDPQDLSRLTDYFDAAALGSVALESSHGLLHSISEALFAQERSRLLVRSAHLPAGGTIDPTIPVSENTSWYLDLDAFEEERTTFSTEALAAKATELAGVAYRYFRTVITDEFIRRFA